MTFAIRKPKCWVNAILPIMFIKEMNKLVTLRMKHDQRANLKSSFRPLSSFVPRCVLAGCIPELHAACISDITSMNLYMQMSGEVCVRRCSSCFTSRWLIAPLVPPSSPSPGVREFWHLSTALNRLCDRTRRDRTALGRCTSPPLRLRECEQA